MLDMQTIFATMLFLTTFSANAATANSCETRYGASVTKVGNAMTDIGKHTVLILMRLEAYDGNRYQLEI